MEKILLKPTRSKIIVSWLAMSLFVCVLMLLLIGDQVTSFLALSIGILWAVCASLVFTVLLYRAPTFTIEINDTHLIGPGLLGMNYRRVQIPIEDIDLQNVNSTLQWMGYYVIPSRKGEKISLWGFDAQQFARLMNILQTASPSRSARQTPPVRIV